MTQEGKKPEGRQSRRRYSADERIKLLDEADQPGESISTVARKHGISPSVMFRWRLLRESGALSGLKADEDLVPASEMKAARAKIRELQRLRKEDRGERDPQGRAGVRAGKRTAIAVAVASTGRRRMTTVAKAFGVARSHLVSRVQSPLAAAQAPACAAHRGQEPPSAGGVKVVGGEVGGDLTPPSTVADAELLQEVRSVITSRATYGYPQSPARRFCRSAGYRVSQVIRKRVEEIFGWAKTVGGFRKTRVKRREKTWSAGYWVMAAYNLSRMARLLRPTSA